MTSNARILAPALRGKVMSADEAAALIPAGVNVGMSGFTGAGYPKAVPAALAKRIMAANRDGEKFRIGVWTGASTAPELDGALAEVDGIELRLPYQSDPTCREQINKGRMEYIDIHLSHVAQFVWFGFLGKLDFALVEVAGILEDGRVIPSSSIGNNKTWIDQADKVILEVNAWQSENLEGMHDIYYGTRAATPPPADPDHQAERPHRQPVLHVPAGEGRWPSWRPTPPIGTRPSPRRTRAPSASPAISWTSCPRGQAGPDAREPPAAAVRRGQHRQRRAQGADGRAVRKPHLLHRGDPGRDARSDDGRQSLSRPPPRLSR